MKEPDFQAILKGKRDYYGDTEAAIQFAAEEYARQYHDWMKTDPFGKQPDLPAENTVMWWLCRIADDEVRRKAVGNRIMFPYTSFNELVDRVDIAIYEGFVWSQTNEGISYWDKLTRDEIPLLPSPEWKEYLELRK